MTIFEPRRLTQKSVFDVIHNLRHINIIYV